MTAGTASATLSTMDEEDDVLCTDAHGPTASSAGDDLASARERVYEDHLCSPAVYLWFMGI